MKHAISRSSVRWLFRAALGLALAMPGLAVAQDFPARPVKMVVPYAAGGAPDVLARLVSQRLSENLGQQFVVENRAGAGGIAASEMVAKSAPDGYTLLVPDVPQLAINPFLFSKLPYDPVKDFVPVSIIAMTPMFIVVAPSLNVDSLAALVALAKSKPGQLTYGSAGIGSLHHIGMESLKVAAGINLVHVPYKGTGQSVPAFIAGDVNVLVSTLAAVEPFVRAGKARLLAGTPSARTPRTPDVPAIAESYPGFHFAGEIGVVAPTGTPPAVIARLSAEVQKATRHPDVVRRLGELGAIAVGSTPEAYAESIRRSLDVFAKAVKASGLKPE
jgi:tripartite-type tricarboxylate transporter receptor subunit TctC